RWSKFPLKFNFIIKCRPGLINVKSNALNRKLEYILKNKINNKLNTRQKLLINSNHFD
ncbi:hypothetical protein NEUTE2DRAFT_67364, partial [Neurospora tetrasperma FGSC 2509]